MRITLSDLTVGFDHLDRAHLLEDWRWLIGSSKQPILLSAVGDAFVHDENDGTCQIHQQVQSLPPGTPVNQIRLRSRPD